MLPATCAYVTFPGLVPRLRQGKRSHISKLSLSVDCRVDRSFNDADKVHH